MGNFLVLSESSNFLFAINVCLMHISCWCSSGLTCALDALTVNRKLSKVIRQGGKNGKEACKHLHCKADSVSEDFVRETVCVCVSVCFLVPRARSIHATNFLFLTFEEKNVENIWGKKGKS